MEISTERTTIRNFDANDFNDLFEYLSLPETYLFEPGEPINIEQAKEITLERSKGNNFFAVVYKPENKLIGHFSFSQIEPQYVNTYEIGYIFNPKYQGRGFATESGKAFIEYCFNEKNVHKIVVNCSPEHQKSWKLAERMGLKREGILEQNIYFKEVNGKPDWLNTAIYGLVNERDFS
ncbi:GNAT family N-acetyltransferase [Thermodesulfobacteriota bacterium]